MSPADASPSPGTFGRRRRPGLGLRASLLVAAGLGLAVVGSAWLKTRHLGGLARRVQWQTADFVLDRPRFDRAGFEAGPWGPAHGTAAASSPSPAERTVFYTAMEAFARADDARALRGLQQVLASHPDWAPARFYRGACELLAGHPMSAGSDLQAAKAGGYSPPDGTCDWWLGVAHLYNGDREAGRECMAAVAGSGSPQATQASAILARLDATRRQ